MTLFDVLDATWPAAASHMAGGFRIREGRGGGSRVSSASLEVPFAEADIDSAAAAHRALGQPPKFIVRPGEEALDAALAVRGYEPFDPVTIYTAPLAALADNVPPVTAFAHWPPLAITREVWDSCGIGPSRQAVAERAPAPKVAILGRRQDRAAGAAFIAIHGGTAMLHGLVVLPAFQRMGLAAAIMAEATRWAKAEGAETLALVVTRANGPANALYTGMGMQPTSHYHYRREASE
ncbi:GNAT family N-acetyltransferase [Paenirhodobacter sp.]|uniref:GNAT family N-acetyltransferase n=1 Tax=Paenirhodobacter sp. TaxID=1965326 RepID=UPI003B3E8801